MTTRCSLTGSSYCAMFFHGALLYWDSADLPGTSVHQLRGFNRHIAPFSSCPLPLVYPLWCHFSVPLSFFVDCIILIFICWPWGVGTKGDQHCKKENTRQEENTVSDSIYYYVSKETHHHRVGAIEEYPLFVNSFQRVSQ